MSNIIGTRRHLIHCAAVALALSAAFVVVTAPKPEMAAATTAEDTAQIQAQAQADVCSQACCLQTCCVQTWPYYEHSCLRDDRRQEGDARAVRVIAVGEHAPLHLSRR
jgi:hypothetical protein